MTIIAVLTLATGVLIAVSLVIIGGRTYQRYRGRRLVTCPETLAPAAVDVDAAQAAVSGLLHAPDLRLSDCSRWPERALCGQECLQQIELSPEGCLISTIVSHWYEGKVCALCAMRFGPLHAWEHEPALLARDGNAFRISDVLPEHLTATFATHRPLCWNCYIAEDFRDQYPALVTDRPARMRPGRAT